MWMLPNEWYFRLHNNYTDVFFLTLLWNISICAMALLLLFFLSTAIRLVMVRKERRVPPQQAQSLLSEERDQPIKEDKPGIIFRAVSIISDTSLYVFLMMLGVIYLSMFIFGKVGTSTVFKFLTPTITFIFIGVCVIFWMGIMYKSEFKVKSKYSIILGVILAVWLGISISGVMIFSDICVCQNIDTYFLSVGSDFVVSTSYSRSRDISKVCPSDEVCHMYATLPEDASTSVFINIHTGVTIGNLEVEMEAKGQSYTKISDGVYLELEAIGQRNLHTILFDSLHPNTLYEVRVIDPSNGDVLKKSRYLTLPQHNETSLRVVVGGDLSLQANGTMLTSNIIEYDPHVIVLGGDNSYDDAMDMCYYNWDTFYWMFEDIYLTINRIIPIVMSVGNHDVGYDALSTATINPQRMPLFFVFNPQHTNADGGIPQINTRSTIHYHVLGDTVLINLDSGYVTSYQEQKYLIEFVSEKYKNKYKFANYHNPIYPYCADRSDNSNDINVINLGHQYWTRLFDHYQFVACMEHHTHHRKITYKIKNQLLDDNGTRYLGDGSWGVKQEICPQNFRSTQPQMFQDYDSHNPNHIWQLTLFSNATSTYINYTAVSITGNPIFAPIIDQLPNLNDY